MAIQQFFWGVEQINVSAIYIDQGFLCVFFKQQQQAGLKSHNKLTVYLLFVLPALQVRLSLKTKRAEDWSDNSIRELSRLLST